MTSPPTDAQRPRSVPVATPGLAVSNTDRSKALVERLQRPEALVVPGVPDALWARLCEAKGFDAVFLSGAGVSNAYLGLADIGLISFPEMLARVQRVVEAVSIPVIVDADTGYGGLSAVARTAAMLEHAGASAIQIEDQQMPKRCGHFDDKTIVSVSAMQARIDAIVQTRRDDNFLVIARTDACAVEGLDAAVDRARRYREAGADILFVEAPETAEDVKEIAARVPDVPLLFNVVEGGKTPALPRPQLEAMGYRILLHANYLLRAALEAGGEALEALRTLSDPDAVKLLSWADRQALVRLPDLDAFEDSLRHRWSADA